MLFVRESSNKCHLYLPGNWLIYFAINRPCAGADGFHLKIPQNAARGNFARQGSSSPDLPKCRATFREPATAFPFAAASRVGLLQPEPTRSTRQRLETMPEMDSPSFGRELSR